MNGIVIARGGTQDLPRIMPVMRAAFDPRFGEAWTEAQCLGILSLPGSRLLVASADEVVGFALSRQILDECELMLLAVRPSSQRSGTGAALLSRVLADAKSDGAVCVHLEARSGNLASRLYSSAGFEQVGRRAGYYRTTGGQTFDALTYRCRLS